MAADYKEAQRTSIIDIGSIANAVGGIVNGFNYQKQENDIAIAEANARAAEASAANAPTSTKKNWLIIIGIVAVVAIVIFVLTKKQG